MGMLIEDCIKELLINKEDDTYVLGNETIDFAISTMRKYQRIERIIDKWNNGKFSDAVGCLQIKAVIEDGKID